MKEEIINSLKTLMKNELKNHLNNYINKKEISYHISNLIKSHIKSLTSNNYKIIVEILLNENNEQGINISTRLFYNKQSDFFFKERIINDTCHCFIVVYLIHV
ncbi:dynein light chain, putative [Plasmodium gallinaceum]|uniref:Dynein light chain, putative n=1 Tax=Plasmodium gallinaceum TaxID=5849 RepID=A0A1J1GYY7_PLAGA|nr:dynein light chain, putative [Plasmodium gallinaceum]CRG96520.1 dynein light chain, putative [Plasmodium gallinaceum]